METEHLEKYVLKIGNEGGSVPAGSRPAESATTGDKPPSITTAAVAAASPAEQTPELIEIKNLEFVEDFEEFFYQFFTWRYPEPEVANQACYEVLLALQSFETKNLVSIFLHPVL